MESLTDLAMNWRSALLGLLMVCTLIALVYLGFRQIEEPSTRWLAALIICINITAIPMVIGFAGAYDLWPGLTFLPTQMMPLYGPLMLLHAHALMRGPPPRWLYALLVPGALYWVYQLWAFTMLGDYRTKWEFNDAIHEPAIFPAMLLVTAGLMVLALVMTGRWRASYLHWLEQHRSDDDAFSPSWITHFLLFAVPLAAVWAIEQVAESLFGVNYVGQYWWDFLALFLTFLITVEALARLREPFPKMLAGKAVSGNPNEPGPEARDWTLEGQRLRLQVMENAWHLEPGLSLQELARRFGSNQTYVSRALNQGLGVSFSDFVNGLRVEHARRLIEKGDLSMIEIALASGFGSKASFNRAFRLHGGESPSQFKLAVDSQ